MIDIHMWPTPNSLKVTILLEEIKLLDPSFEYQVVPCSIGTGDQFKEDFIKISPNNRMPALVDHKPLGGGEAISIFESGAMMLYIAEKTGYFWPTEPAAKYDVVQWVMWQMANQGPKFGEAGHFRRVDESHGDQSYGKQRYNDEVNRCYGVMNNRLYDQRYLAGNEYTIADMISYPWCTYLEAQGEDINNFKYFKRWWDELSERPGLKAGMEVGSDLNVDVSQYTEEEIKEKMSLLFNQRARPAPETGGIE